MSKVYKGQTKLRLSVSLETDITGGTAKLKYIKPSGEKGEFNASIIDEVTGLIEYSPANSNTFDEVGIWIIWGYVVFSDNKEAAGEPFKVIFHQEGK